MAPNLRYVRRDTGAGFLGGSFGSVAMAFEMDFKPETHPEKDWFRFPRRFADMDELMTTLRKWMELYPMEGNELLIKIRKVE